ncbi:PIG-L family deacetylase [Marininema halotolerans]|nr:PIG-L family deacetylase [Marininema halotolerans]
MKKTHGLILLLLLIICWALINEEVPYVNSQTLATSEKNTLAQAKTKKAIPRPVIYLVPHADDETLTYGVDIQKERQRGRPIYLILFSQGEESIAREVLNGHYDHQSVNKNRVGEPILCRWHGRIHSPNEEHFADGSLSRKEFGKARIRDFYRVAKVLGIPSSHIRTYSLPNDHFTPSQVQSVIDSALKKFPGADFRTMSPYDVHPDHALIGKELANAIQTNKISASQVHYFVSIYTDRFAKVDIPFKKHISTIKKGSKAYIRLVQSMDVYRDYDPKQGSYATGYHSVPKQFDALIKATYTSWYLPQIAPSNKKETAG